jgi:hypothetical protein
VGIDCPACNKPGQTEAVCARCGCDLTRLRAVAEAAVAASDRARDALHLAEWEHALAWAERSWDLFHSKEAARTAFLASAALGQTGEALQWHGRSSR